MKRFILDNLSIASIEAPKNKDRDLLYVIFKLCHEGANANHDYFTQQILEEAYPTCVNKPINWEHSRLCFGFIDKSELLQEKDGRYYIQCGGYIWQYNFPSVAKEIIDGFADGTLKVSMECWFRDAEYWIGEGKDKQVLTEEEAKAKGILNTEGDLVRLFVGDQPVYRVFKDVLFGGAAVVRNPADEDAVILAVAENRFNPVKVYHDLLHRVYELNYYNYLSEKEVIEEHRRLHEKFGGLLN